MKWNNDIDELINRWLEAKASAEEAERLDEWLAEDKSHVQYFLRCKNLHDLCRPPFSPEQISTERALSKIMRTVGRRRRLVLRWAAAAAVVLLCAGTSMLLWESSRQDMAGVPVQVVQKTDTLPRQAEGITLTLASGEKVDLDAHGSRQITDADGVLAQVSDKTLAYENKDIAAEEEVVYHVLNVPKGKEFYLALSDGTKIWVNAETEVKYPVKFPAHERRIFVSGEAYLEVAHNADAPFTVVMPQNEVTVLGTSFNVKAYPEEDTRQITLVTGKVEVTSLLTQQSVTLQPGEQAVSEVAGGNIEKHQVDTDLYCAWHRGSLVFCNNTLEEIFGLLSRRYDVDIVWEDEALKCVSFSGEITKYDQIEKVLKVVGHTGDVEFIQDGRRITIAQP